MKNFHVLIEAINYIEENLCNYILQEDIARECYFSLSSLQKLFRYAFNHSIKEYITKRRLTNAAKDIVNSQMTITEIAMKYQYNSPEVFTRAFSKLWGISPSKFKNQWKFTGIFPKLILEYNGGNVVTGKKVEISELYEVLKENQNTYVLCFDIVGFGEINKISYEFGDKVILQCLKRIDTVAKEDMMLFRIGGDEFALVTWLTEASEAENLAKTVLESNGEFIDYNGQGIPVSMRVGATKIFGNNIRYNELLDDLQNTINVTRENKKEIFLMD
ncbi:helix-turn-helix domain-containing protein [Clostridium cellulovorans]|uniref:Transcriptional regulator, AraC family n=1 Tax=Clostridium cellulovorans (strain ATCC 35296 / DSM 3052 / OCM 3 / 743B) TaxID=573061 RepID=D9ST09_CLOC7|nr:helix-turn-helix domain-containing protein [Clostridium cellulovorans]ADL52671.1 transcriptional regulator, AraC family [Clostridium cellulovorans 743B]